MEVPEDIEKQFSEAKISDKFDYRGYVKNIYELLSEFDVLGYPLAPYHTCTTENAILEAMTAPVVPVLINQLTEKYIVKHGETGFLVSSTQEYGEVMKYLYENPDIRKGIDKNARKFVLTKYNINNILEKLNLVFDELSDNKKRDILF